jgi:hypothetical protein
LTDTGILPDIWYEYLTFRKKIVGLDEHMLYVRELYADEIPFYVIKKWDPHLADLDQFKHWWYTRELERILDGE